MQPAFVLHRRDYSDTSLLVELFTAEHGRLPLLAKGAKRRRSPGSALLQPFTPILVSWTGRGEVATMVRVEPSGRPVALTGDALFCGFYVNELLMRLLGRQDPHAALFAFYQVVLKELADGEDLETPLRRFELRLLAELGYQAALDRESNDGPPLRAEQAYLYSREQGLVPAVSSGTDGAISGETLRRLVVGDVLSGVHAREARHLTRCLLEPHLGHRPLNSRVLFAARSAARNGAKTTVSPSDGESGERGA